MTTTRKTNSTLRAGVVFTWAALAGCSAIERSNPLPTVTTTPATSTQTLTTTDVAVQQPQHSAGASDPPKAARSAANEAKSANLAAPQINDDPQQLLGLSGIAVARRLGAPSLVRRDGPAEIWQYQETACILDVFLYTNTDGQHVRYVELRSPRYDDKATTALLRKAS